MSLGVNRFCDLPPELRPRERMVAAGRTDMLSDRDLLMVMLKTGTFGCDVEETAKRLLCAFGSLGEFVRCSWLELEIRLHEWNKLHPDKRVLGVGRAKILELAAAFELAKRGFREGSGAVTTLTINSAEDAVTVFLRTLQIDEEKELFRVLLLDVRRHPLCEVLPVSSGSIDGTFVHPREVFKEAIRRGAHSVMVSHNHPGGSSEPSPEDLDLTRRLVEAGNIVGVPLLDHIILGVGMADKDGVSFTARTGGGDYLSIRALHPNIFMP